MTSLQRWFQRIYQLDNHQISKLCLHSKPLLGGTVQGRIRLVTRRSKVTPRLPSLPQTRHFGDTKQKDLGFLELSTGQTPVVDIVAIHGLDGHRERSWAADDGTMWLKDLLPGDLPNTRILTYGYDADTRSFTRTSTQSIFRHAEAFSEDLSRQRRAAPERPIIFLAHSLGGIILKRALSHCNIHSIESNRSLRSILTSTLAVLFFGTPHSGANGVQLVEWMCRLLSVYMSTTNKVLEDLNKDSPALEELQVQYLPASERLDTIFFYEEYETPIVGGLKKMIVPRHLAIIAGERRAKTVVLHADHCTMVKFTGKDDINYRKVVDYLHELLEQATDRVQKSQLREMDDRNTRKGESALQRAVLPKPLMSVSRNYIQRPHIEEFITQKLLSSTPAKHQPRCILHGLGGGGKTQVASSWIEAHRERFSRIVVVDASSQQQIEADMETAIRSIGPNYGNSSWKDAVAYLSGQMGWLLLFDNADSPNLRLDDYLPNSIHGAILVTTRNRDCISYAPDSHIEVGMLTEDEAVDLLHKVANVSPSTNASSLAIVKELGMWALAITQAGAYIFKTGRLDTYLSTFQKHRDKLLREASLNGRNYKGSTYTALELSFGQLSPKAQALMKICAFLHYSSIPLALFEQSTVNGFRAHTVEADYPPSSSSEAVISHLKDILGLEWDEHLFQTLIDSTSRGSLLNTSIDYHGNLYYNLHPLVQAYIQDLFTQAGREFYSILAGQLLLGAIRPLTSGEANSWHRLLSFHVDRLPPEVKLAHPSHAVAFRIIYGSIGNWNAMQEIDRHCYSQFQNDFGPRHSSTLTAMANLAATLHRCGQQEQAEKMQRQVLALSTEIRGPQDPKTVIAMANLATVLADRGQFDESEKMARDVLALQTAIHGRRHPYTVGTMANLAETLRDRGQLEEAEKMQREVLLFNTEIHGWDHHETVRVLGNLVVTLVELDKLEEAEKGQLVVVMSQLEALGSQHPDTIRALANLAAILCHRGRLEDAETMQRDVLVMQTESLGQHHPDTITAMANLAATLQKRGQFEEAESMQREVLLLRREKLGQYHPHTVSAVTNLAGTLALRGRFEEAEKMERDILEFQLENGGREHPNTILAMVNLATTLRHGSKFEEAETIGREVLALRTEILGQDDLGTTLAMAELARTLADRGQLEEAEKMEREVLAVRMRKLGQKNRHTIDAMADLATTLADRGQLEEAVAMQRDVLALRTEVLGPQHPRTILAGKFLSLSLAKLARGREPGGES